MNILVLGASGYLGGHVLTALMKEGHFLICPRRNTAGKDGSYDLMGNGRRGGVWIPCEQSAVERELGKTTVDLFLNMQGNYGRENISCNEIIDSNLTVPLAIMNNALESGVRKFVSIGTSLPVGLNMYSFSKDVFARFGEFYASKFDINFADIKLEMFYGADEPQNRFISGLIHDMIEGKEINVTLGKQFRDIIFVKDVVKAILRIADYQYEGYLKIPVGTGRGARISEIVDFVWKKTGQKSKINYGAVLEREGEPDCIANTEMLERIFEKDGGWHPMMWQEGLARVIYEIGLEKTSKESKGDCKSSIEVGEYKSNVETD